MTKPKLRSLLAGAAGLVLAPVLASTAGAAELQASCGTPSPTIGVALPGGADPGAAAIEESLRKHGAELGFTIAIVRAGNSGANQLSEIEAFAQQGVCAVVLSPIETGAGAAAIKTLNDAGIPVFTVGLRLSDADLEARGAAVIEHVGADQAAGGRAIGAQAVEDLGPDAAMIVGVVGDPDRVATNQRDQGFRDAIAADRHARIVATMDSGSDPGTSQKVAGQMLDAHPEINVIWADSGPAAAGALQAVRQQGRADSVRLYGFCAADTPPGSTYAACAAPQPAAYARIALDNLKKYLAGKAVPREVLRPPKIHRAGEQPGPGEAK
jgi:ribose transport system substrate-binding protein